MARLYSSGNGTQALEHARQILYRLNYILKSFLGVDGGIGIWSHYVAHGGFRLRCLSFPRVGHMGCWMPHLVLKFS